MTWGFLPRAALSEVPGIRSVEVTEGLTDAGREARPAAREGACAPRKEDLALIAHAQELGLVDDLDAKLAGFFQF